MAVDSSEELSRRRFDGIWRVDHLETGIRSDPKRDSRDNRAGLHDSIRTGSRHLHPVRARLILAFIILNAGAVGGVFAVLLQGRPG